MEVGGYKIERRLSSGGEDDLEFLGLDRDDVEEDEWVK